MKKLTKICAAATALILAFGFAGCGNGSTGGGNGDNGDGKTYPNFINRENSGDDPDVGEKYVVNVLSEGGLKLEGVKVAAKRNGTVIKRGISQKGKIEFGVDLGEYDLVVDEESLPQGYYLPENASYKTSATSRDAVTIRIPSKVIDASAPTSSYAVGNIMRDFTFTDCYGARYTLSKLLETKKAVVLNFFYTDCAPCRSEFPYVQQAYQNIGNTDIELLAISPTTKDTDESVKTFKEKNNLTFPMGVDRLGLTDVFQRGYPTTVVIDRYGLIAYRTAGSEPKLSFWTGLFAKYTDLNYVQDVAEAGSGDVGTEIEKPNVSMPASQDLEKAALNENTSAVFTAENNEYSWPWLAGSDADGGYIYSSNKGKNNSYAIVHAEIAMQEGQVLSFEYKVSSENGDKLHVMLDGDPMNDGWAGEGGDWTHVDLYVADRDKKVDLAFTYRKDGRDASGDDVAKIRNISLADKSTIEDTLDVMRACASGRKDGKDEIEDFKYKHYVNAVFSDPEEGGDGYYHKDTADGPIIYMSLNQLTPWSYMHVGTTSQGANGVPYVNTLYNMTANQYVNTEGEVTVVINGKDLTEAYTVYVLIMPYMPAPFYLLPATPQLKEWADEFIAAFEKGAEHDDEWLEFCYYYDHYGAEHDDKQHGDGATCKVDEDYTLGLTMYNAYTAYEKSTLAEMAEIGLIEDSVTYNADTGRNRATISYPLQLVHNGAYYKFTAESAGVYQIRSFTTDCSPTDDDDDDNLYSVPDPKLQVYDSKGKFRMISGFPIDFDMYKGEEYEGFNEYLTLEEGEVIYLYLETTSSTMSFYDFEITYLGETAEKLFITAIEGVWWTYNDDDPNNIYWIYPGKEVEYDSDSDCFYATKNGVIDYDQPVYINMLYQSFLLSNQTQYNYAPLKTMIENNAFEDLWHGEEQQAKMEKYLGLSTEGKEKSDWDYGLVKANREIVDVINMYISKNVDNVPGQTTGWLMFGVYVAQLGK